MTEERASDPQAGIRTQAEIHRQGGDDREVAGAIPRVRRWPGHDQQQRALVGEGVAATAQVKPPSLAEPK